MTLTNNGAEGVITTPPSGPRVVVVTGAKGGIGSATCAEFLSNNATVIGIDRSSSTGVRLDGVEYLQADVTDTAAIRSLANEVCERFGRIDVWVNNAGMLNRIPSLELEEAEWQASIDVNLKAMFFGAQAAARHMATQGSGSIVNLSSYAGIKARPGCSDYAAAKAGVAHLTACLAMEWGPLGIRVNAVAPGYIETPMSAWMHGDPEQRAIFTERTPLRRIGMPTEVAQAIAYLASDAASYVTGNVMYVDGGITKA